MRNTPGLKFDGKQWIIDKRVKDFGRIFERTGLGKEEGEKALKRFHTLVQQAMDKGQRAADGVMTFPDAAARFLKEATKRSLGRDIYALERLVPVIGDMTLDEIHQGTLQPYVDLRRKQGSEVAPFAGN